MVGVVGVIVDVNGVGLVGGVLLVVLSNCSLKDCEWQEVSQDGL